MRALLFVLLWLVPASAFGQHLHKEKEYQARWCDEADGEMEYVLDDATRIDCVTDEYAIEFDFSKKWAESVGQALYYAEMTGLKPGVVLILERPEEKRYLERLQRLAEKFKIRVWTMTPGDIEQ